jgi:hypothetical protein
VLRYTDAVAVVTTATPWSEDAAAPVSSPSPSRARNGANVWEAPRAPEAGSGGRASAPYVYFGTAAAPAAARDTPAAHLECVAALIEAAADPASSEPLPAAFPGPARDAFLNFVSSAARSEALHHHAGAPGYGAAARCGVLRVMRAFASTRDAAVQIMTQLELHAEHEDYMHLSWARYCHLLSEARRKYLDYEQVHGAAAVATGGALPPSPPPQWMPMPAPWL